MCPQKIATRQSSFKADIEYLEYGTASGNGLLQVTAAFRDYLAGLFPAIPPYPAVNLVAANGVDRHHHPDTTRIAPVNGQTAMETINNLLFGLGEDAQG